MAGNGMLASGDRVWAAASRGGFGAAHVWALIVAVLAVAAFGLAAPQPHFQGKIVIKQLQRNCDMKNTIFCYNNYSLPISKQFLNFQVDEIIISTFFLHFYVDKARKGLGWGGGVGIWGPRGGLRRKG